MRVMPCFGFYQIGAGKGYNNSTWDVALMAPFIYLKKKRMNLFVSWGSKNPIKKKLTSITYLRNWSNFKNKIFLFWNTFIMALRSKQDDAFEYCCSITDLIFQNYIFFSLNFWLGCCFPPAVHIKIDLFITVTIEGWPKWRPLLKGNQKSRRLTTSESTLQKIEFQWLES